MTKNSLKELLVFAAKDPQRRPIALPLLTFLYLSSTPPLTLLHTPLSLTLEATRLLEKNWAPLEKLQRLLPSNTMVGSGSSKDQ